MDVLIWSPNYAPEAMGIPPLATDAAEGLVARGHRVRVVTPVPNYPERLIQEPYRGVLWTTEARNGVTVCRHWLRVRSPEKFIDKGLYELTSATAALRFVLPLYRKADVVLCIVPTLAASVYAALLPASPRLVLWAQDVVLAAAESLESSKALIARAAMKTAARLERLSAARADRVIVCSPGFVSHYEKLGVGPERISVVYNWADVAAFPPTSSTPVGGHPTRFLYAGNLGYTQGFATLVEAAKQSGTEVSVSIVGAGNAEAEVRTLAEGTSNVSVQPPVGREQIPDLYASTDVHVVIQRRVSAGANLPSKIATCLASGKPVIASIDPNTPAAALLRESEGALLVPPEDPRALAEAMRSLAADEESRRRLGERGRAFAVAVLSKEAAVGEIERLLQA